MSDAVRYYEAFELALSALTELGEYRRHFGSSAEPPPAGYCWFKGVLSPARHPSFTAWLRHAGDQLEDRLLSELPRLRPRSVLDVGCGNGALLRRLSRELPSAELYGINVQSRQVRFARALLQATNATIVEADFLQYDFERRFDLAVFFESAFHFPNKTALLRRLSEVLNPRGEVWLIDIVISERAASSFGEMGGDSGALFNFVPRREWQRRAAEFGLSEAEYVSFTRGAAEVLTVSNLDTLRDEYLRPRLSEALGEASPELLPAIESMMQVATEYRRLSRLLRAGMLEYVLMRYRRDDA